MNLLKIKDAKEVKKLTQLYKLLPTIDERNFFFRLAAKIAPYVLNRHKKSSDYNQMTTSFSINGNAITFKYPNLSLQINGVKIPASGEGVKWISQIIHSIFALESTGELVINRPDGFSRKKERLQFKSAEGTVFPTIVNSVAYATGELDLSVKGTSANKIFLTETQYKQAKDKDKFEEHNNSVMKYFIRKGSNVIDLTDKVKSASRVIYALQNFDKPNQSEYLKRVGLYKLIDSPDFTNPNYIIVVGDEVFVCEAHEKRAPGIKEIKINKPEIETPEVTLEEREELEHEFEAFKLWCKDNDIPVNAKNYEQFAEKVNKGEIKL